MDFPRGCCRGKASTDHDLKEVTRKDCSERVTGNTDVWFWKTYIYGKSMENHHAINGKIHYFDWAIFNSYVSLSEGM